MTQQGGSSSWARILAVILFATAGAVGMSLLQYLRLAPQAGTIELSSVPTGVSARLIGETPVFIVRRDRALTVFLADPQHLPGENVLWWCATERLFASPTHGELFDEEGRPVAGPAARGLTRFRAAVRDKTVYIDLEARVESTAERRPRLPAAVSDRRWNSGPRSFCNAPIRSDRL